MKKTYQGTLDPFKGKFAALRNREWLVQVPLPLVEGWEENKPRAGPPQACGRRKKNSGE